MDDNELEAIELSDDELSDDLDVDESNHINSQANSAPSFLSKKNVARQQIDNKINNYGTGTLKKAGIPEPLAKQAIKKNGGTFSPTNMPANKLASNLIRNKLASGLSMVGGKLPFLNNLSSNKKDINKNSENSDHKKYVNNKSNASSNNVVNTMISMFSPALKLKIAIIGVIAIVIVLMLIIIMMVATGSKFDDVAAIASSVAQEKVLYQGKNYEVMDYLVEAGYCDEDDCENSNANKYLNGVNELFDEYKKSQCTSSNYKIDEAINLIVSTATYEREVEEYYGLDMLEDEYEKQLEIYLEEYQKLNEHAFIEQEINDETDNEEASVCYTFNHESYKSYVVSEEGYLDTYRDDLGELTEEEKNSIYDVITGDAEEVKINIEESSESVSSDIVSGGTSMIISSVCTGVIVTGENAGVYSLDEYVAGVVENENDWYRGDNIENMKAQAVAARTYVLRKTNNCKNSIKNSAEAQTFDPNPSEKARQAALETSNQVLMDNNGNYISAEYDAFCYSSKNSSYYTVQNNLQIPTSWVDDNISSWKYKNCQCGLNDPSITGCWNTTDSGRTVWADGGHGRGMSQWGSRYLQTIGYTYDKILSTFYENSTLKTLGNSVTSNIPNTVKDLQDRYWFTYDINTYLQYEINKTSHLFGQCVWYAKHRALEILSTSPHDETTKQTLINVIKTLRGNGQDWYISPYQGQSSTQYNTLFERSPDINKPKAGAIVSWTYGTYGHVGIIEKVYQENGQTMVVLTDGGRTKKNNKWYYSENLWELFRLAHNESNPLTLYELQNLYGYKFNGYVYLY